jgi:probable F420-dependent oxidoreductase
MKVGVQLPHFGPQASGPGAVEVAETAERLGFDSVWVGDHIVYPEDQIPRFGAVFFEALTTLGWVGARTRRIALGTGVLVLPYRHPLVLAKELATLDALSGGRLVVGVGAGWNEAEFAALGVPFAERGDWTDEAIRLLRVLWTDDRPTFEGHRFRVSGLVVSPRPASPPPIWVGGVTPRARRRAAELGDGWLPIWHRPTGRGFTVEGLREAIDELGERAARAGRPRPVLAGLMPIALLDDPGDERQPLVGPPGFVVETLARFREAGLEHVVLNPYYGISPALMPRDLPHCRELLARFAAEVLPRFRGGSAARPSPSRR